MELSMTRGAMGAARSLITALLAFAWMFVSAQASFSQSWEPSQDQARAARAAVETFLAAHDRGDTASAYAMLSEEFRTLESETSFSRSVQAFNEDAGGLVGRTITDVTWYKDTPGAPRAGVYAAFDMVARFANIDRYCGYVIVHQPPEGGPFKIMRLEQTFLDNAQARSFALNNAQPPLEEYWSQLAAAVCPGWRAPAMSSAPEQLPDARPS